MPVEYLTPAIEDPAVEARLLLVREGHHRAPPIPDLVIAAVAELAGLTVLHLDKDFELIAALTARPSNASRSSAGAPGRSAPIRVALAANVDGSGVVLDQALPGGRRGRRR